MKKIIEVVGGAPNCCESAKFPARFASVWMRIEGITSPEQVEHRRFCDRMPSDDECCGRCGTKEVNWLGQYHGKVHNLYAVVSGISLMQLNLSVAGSFEPWWGPNTNKLLEEYDDYIKFTMGFAGYMYERFEKNADKAIIFDSIKHSIDAGRPALMNFGPFYDWFAITGYDDESGWLYGYDVSQDNRDKFPAAKGYEDGMFYLSGWHEEMTEAVVITGKTTPKNTYDDMFRRMIRILETTLETGYFKLSADFLRDNANFKYYDDEQYRQLS